MRVYSFGALGSWLFDGFFLALTWYVCMDINFCRLIFCLHCHYFWHSRAMVFIFLWLVYWMAALFPWLGISMLASLFV